MGGYFTPQIKPDSWTENKDWSADLGAYFSALAGSDAWTDVEYGRYRFETRASSRTRTIVPGGVRRIFGGPSGIPKNELQMYKLL